MSDMPQALPVALAIVFLIAIGIARHRRHAASARRAEQLRLAAALLGEHVGALEDFCADPEAPASLTRLLLDFSAAMENEVVALSAAESAGHGSFPQSPAAQSVITELNELRTRRPDLADKFSIGIGTAFAAAFLRWPSVAAFFETAAARLVADPNREIMVAAEKARQRSMLRPALKAA